MDGTSLIKNIYMVVVAQRCIESILRVLINLTHDNPAWCRALVDNGKTLGCVLRVIVGSHPGNEFVVKKEEEEDDEVVLLKGNGEGNEEESEEARVLDRLCLGLGLLTNLVQGAERTKDLVREIGASVYHLSFRKRTFNDGALCCV